MSWIYSHLPQWYPHGLTISTSCVLYITAHPTFLRHIPHLQRWKLENYRTVHEYIRHDYGQKGETISYWCQTVKAFSRSMSVYHNAQMKKMHNTQPDDQLLVSQLQNVLILDSTYHQVSNIRRTLVGNKIVYHSDVVGTSPVGAAPTTSSLST